VAQTTGDPLAMLAAGRARLAAGETINALVLLRTACAGLPENGEAHFLLGATLHRLKQLPAALTAFDRAFALDPENLQAAHASLAVLGELGHADEARVRVEALLAGRPKHSQLHYDAALVFESLGEFARAVLHCEQTLQIEPEHFEALLNRGVALTKLKRLDEAIANNMQLVAAHPERVESHFNLAEVSLAASRYKDAIAYAESALGLDPRHAGAILDRGLALAALGQIEEAQVELDRAAAHGTSEAPLDAREVYLVRGYDRLESCDWSELATLRTRFADMVRNDSRRGPCSPALCWRGVMLGFTPELQLKLARETAQQWRTVVPLARAVRPDTSGEKIRVGYVSSDFGDHPCGHLLAGVFGRHDRKHFEVYAYALSVDDGSSYRRRAARDCDVLIDVSAHSSRQIAEQIRSDRIDVLVNVNGYTTGHRTEVFALRPAPVQMSYLGYPGTMGADFTDYVIADRWIVPKSDERWYSESIVRLPICYQVNDPDEGLLSPPARAAERLPADAFVFCNFNQHVKLTPEVFGVWMRILRAMPSSVLWLVDGAGRENLCRHAAAAGVAPERLIFAPRVPREQYLARSRLADLFLDTRPYNSHTTASDALWSGVPLVTCPGGTFASRVAASLLRAAGLNELVVGSMHEYESLAAALAQDPPRLRNIRDRLESGRASLPVFDLDARVKELEAAYRHAVARDRGGLPPASVSIPA
jgi:predicted O-linked N-acetylglucosamine transferase (SPINDLY family)